MDELAPQPRALAPRRRFRDEKIRRAARRIRHENPHLDVRPELVPAVRRLAQSYLLLERLYEKAKTLADENSIVMLESWRRLSQSTLRLEEQLGVLPLSRSQIAPPRPSPFRVIAEFRRAEQIRDARPADDSD